MTQDRKEEIIKSIIYGMSAFGVDKSEPYQSMGILGLSHMIPDIPRDELMSVLISMEGVVVDFEVHPAEVRIPTSYF